MTLASKKVPNYSLEDKQSNISLCQDTTEPPSGFFLPPQTAQCLYTHRIRFLPVPFRMPPSISKLSMHRSLLFRPRNPQIGLSKHSTFKMACLLITWLSFSLLQFLACGTRSNLFSTPFWTVRKGNPYFYTETDQSETKPLFSFSACLRSMRGLKAYIFLLKGRLKRALSSVFLRVTNGLHWAQKRPR